MCVCVKNVLAKVSKMTTMAETVKQSNECVKTVCLHLTEGPVARHHTNGSESEAGQSVKQMATSRMAMVRFGPKMA